MDAALAVQRWAGDLAGFERVIRATWRVGDDDEYRIEQGDSGGR
jgi:hypothetical protein